MVAATKESYFPLSETGPNGGPTDTKQSWELYDLDQKGAAASPWQTPGLITHSDGTPSTGDIKPNLVVNQSLESEIAIGGQRAYYSDLFNLESLRANDGLILIMMTVQWATDPDPRNYFTFGKNANGSDAIKIVQSNSAIRLTFIPDGSSGSGQSNIALVLTGDPDYTQGQLERFVFLIDMRPTAGTSTSEPITAFTKTEYDRTPINHGEVQSGFFDTSISDGAVRGFSDYKALTDDNFGLGIFGDSTINGTIANSTSIGRDADLIELSKDLVFIRYDSDPGSDVLALVDDYLVNGGFPEVPAGSSTLTLPFPIGNDGGPLFSATSSDTIATVEDADFLNNIPGWASLLETNDVVIIECSDGTKMYTVTVDQELRIISLSTGLVIA